MLAGTSSTMAIHQPADTTIAAAAIARSRMRRQNPLPPNARCAAPSPGTINSTWSCLVRNPNPTATPVATNHFHAPLSMARRAK